VTSLPSLLRQVLAVGLVLSVLFRKDYDAKDMDFIRVRYRDSDKMIGE
jgi:hypothetical protein